MTSTTSRPLCMLNTMQEHGARAWVRALAYDELLPRKDNAPNAMATHKYLVMASVANASQEIQRIFGAINRHDSLAVIEDRKYYLVRTPTQVTYQKWQTKLVDYREHALILHPAATIAGVSKAKLCYLVNQTHYDETTGPPPQFFEFLNRMTDLPMRPDWADWLWTMAHQQGWLRQCPGYRITVWRCEPDFDHLALAIQQAIQQHLIR